MRTSTWVASILLASAAVGLPRDASACTTTRTLSQRAPLFLLVTAQGDTVRAGQGPIRYTEGTDRDSAAVYGQVFRLDRAGGEVPRELAAARAAGLTGVVLVPHNAVCRARWRWRDGARWARPGSQVMVDATLRPRAQWVGGRPTFDVDQGHDVFPKSYMWARKSDREDQPVMTPAQVFEMTRALPTWEEAERAPFEAYRPLLRWARANPQLIERFPADEVLEEVQEALEPCKSAYDPHPVAGTYRVTVTAGPDTLSAFFQTAADGYPECPAVQPRLDLTAVTPRRAETLSLHVHGAPTQAEIPATYLTANRNACSITTMKVADRPDAVREERRWRAEYGVLPGCFPGSPRIQEAVAAASAAYQGGDRTSAPGVFTTRPDGTVTFEQTWRVGGRAVLEVRGTRVSPETVP